MAELLARVHWKRVNQPCQDSKKIIGIESAFNCAKILQFIQIES